MRSQVNPNSLLEVIMDKLYKVLNSDGTSFWGGTGVWNLPHDNIPGVWMPPIKRPLALCKRGYHVLRFEHLLDWLGPSIFEVEVEGEMLWGYNKGVCSSARLLRRLDAWNDRNASLFTWDCADRVRHLMNEQSKQAIDIATAFEEDAASAKETATAWVAASAAAWAAGGAAAGAAAWAAERKWQTQRLKEILGEN